MPYSTRRSSRHHKILETKPANWKNNNGTPQKISLRSTYFIWNIFRYDTYQIYRPIRLFSPVKCTWKSHRTLRPDDWTATKLGYKILKKKTPPCKLQSVSYHLWCLLRREIRYSMWPKASGLARCVVRPWFIHQCETSKQISNIPAPYFYFEELEGSEHQVNRVINCVT